MRAMPPTPSLRRHSPAAERNAPHILAVLQRVLPPQGFLLEVASGSGQHAAHCAPGLPGWRWQPTEASAELLASITDWCAGCDTVLPPCVLNVLDALGHETGVAPGSADAMLCINMIHASPWAATPALMRLAARCLTPQGVLLTYGPYLEDAVPTAPSNIAFDTDLRARHPEWGLRRLADVAAAAAEQGLALQERVFMPANNRMLIWARR